MGPVLEKQTVLSKQRYLTVRQLAGPGAANSEKRLQVPEAAPVCDVYVSTFSGGLLHVCPPRWRYQEAVMKSFLTGRVDSSSLRLRPEVDIQRGPGVAYARAFLLASSGRLVQN